MASIITATTTSGLTQSADNSGVLQLASGTGNLVTVPAVTGTAMVSGNMPAFSAYKSTDQTVTSGVMTKVTFDTEVFDTNNNFASSTFTPTVAGYYQVNATIAVQSTTTLTVIAGNLYKNGVLYRYGVLGIGINGNTRANLSDLVYMNGTTDYLEIYARGDGATVSFVGGAEVSSFSACLVRAA